MKLSFSLASSKNPSKPSKSTACSSKDQDNQSPKKEFVTEFDSSLTLVDTSTFLDAVDELVAAIREWTPMAAEKAVTACLDRAEDLLPSGTINDLHEISKRMVAAGYGKECSLAYSSCRRDLHGIAMGSRAPDRAVCS